MSDKSLVGYGAIGEEDTEIIDEDDVYQKKEQPRVVPPLAKTKPKSFAKEAPSSSDDDDDDSDSSDDETGRPTSRPLISERPTTKAATSLVSSSYGKEGESDSDSGDSNEEDLINLLKKGGIQKSAHNIENVGSAANSSSPASVDTNDSAVGLDEKDDRKKVILDPLESVKLPPEPEGRCSRSLQDKIAKMLEKKYRGKLSLNEHVQKKKDFRNPSIYEKLVLYCGIDETGTNYPRHLYSPSSWGPESYYDALGKAQKEAHEKKEKEKQKRMQVEFVTATKKATGTLISTAQKFLDENKKKSKWDFNKSESSTITNSSDTSMPIKKAKIS